MPGNNPIDVRQHLRMLWGTPPPILIRPNTLECSLCRHVHPVHHVHQGDQPPRRRCQSDGTPDRTRSRTARTVRRYDSLSKRFAGLWRILEQTWGPTRLDDTDQAMFRRESPERAAPPRPGPPTWRRLCLRGTGPGGRAATGPLLGLPGHAAPHTVESLGMPRTSTSKRSPLAAPSRVRETRPVRGSVMQRAPCQ